MKASSGVERPATVAAVLRVSEQEQDWNELAELDPFFAVVSRPGKRFGGWDTSEFFATGTRQVTTLMARIEPLGHPRERSRALDFGCGLGRLTRALGAEFQHCVGVDISERMVEQAQQLNADVSGVSFVVNSADDLRMFSDGEFDLVYSSIVLQHVPDRRAIESYIADFCRILRPGGLAVFQLPSRIPALFRLQWRRRLYLGLRRLGLRAPFLYGRLHLLPIAMSFIPEADVVRLVESRGARVLDLDTESATGRLAAGLRSSTYYVTR
jgi:ubiquinone/menaquinone biosynthesis C-methylase UbiE